MTGWSEMIGVWGRRGASSARTDCSGDAAVPDLKLGVRAFSRWTVDCWQKTRSVDARSPWDGHSIRRSVMIAGVLLVAEDEEAVERVYVSLDEGNMVMLMPFRAAWGR